MLKKIWLSCFAFFLGLSLFPHEAKAARFELEPRLILRSFWGSNAENARNALSGGLAFFYQIPYPAWIFSAGPEFEFFTLKNSGSSITVLQGGGAAGFYFKPVIEGKNPVRPILFFHLGGGMGETENQKEACFYGGISAGFLHEVSKNLNLKASARLGLNAFESGLIYRAEFVLSLGFLF